MKNSTKHSVTIPRKTALGSVQAVARVIETSPLEVSRPRVVVSAAITPTAQATSKLWQPPVELSHVGDEEQEKVKKMLWEESAAFAWDSHDIGCSPVYRCQSPSRTRSQCSSIPIPLFKEVKEYVQDLLMKGWIVKLKSSYAALVVCVREKKDCTLRLCIDYHLLNQKTIP